jgi:antitoxin component YwqK of YwqJK toxin-antitoxin module
MLLHDTHQRDVFLCRALASYYRYDGVMCSDVEVLEVYKGQIDKKRLHVTTGRENTSMPGTSWSVDQIWFVCSKITGEYFSAGPCDIFSRPTNNSITNAHWDIAEDFKDKTMRHYTGKVEWKTKEGIVWAYGQFVNGRPHGKWVHNDYEGKQTTSCEYRNGLLHGIMKKSNRAGRIDTNVYENGRLVKSTSYSGFEYTLEETIVDSSEWGLLKVNTMRYGNGNLMRSRSVWSLPTWMKASGLDGPVLEADTSGQIRIKGTYFMGAKVGDWLEWDEKKTALQATTYPFPSIPNTDIYFFHENGQVSVTGNLVNMLPDSIWNYYDNKGRLYLQCRYVAGVKQGEEVEYGTYRDSNYIKSINTYVDGLLESTSIEYSTPGKILEKIDYQNGRMTGSIARYTYEGLPLLSGTLENGVLQGVATEYERRELPRQQAKTAKVWVGQYKNGIRIGEWTAYDEQGNKLSTCQMNPKSNQTYQSSRYGDGCLY